MDFKKDKYGYFIEVESLNATKEFNDFIEDAEMLYRGFNDKSYMLPTSLGLTLRCDGLEVEDCHLWLSDGLTGLASKLQDWSRLSPYYTLELDGNQKEDYINRMMVEFVHDRDYKWLKEIFDDAMETYECETEAELYEVFDFYNDISLSEIASYLWDVFCNSATMYEIDKTLESLLGYYGDAMVFKIESEGYYLFFN